ncbi:putative polymerase [Roseibium hamelinense]|uniref:Putative polymerase n=2 Tax=Roseibium hamelinense TaxID=150831 RepID=A0A562T0K4_9HYPH|nr:putative polymerase [Roseibium hamelinense]
MLSSKPLNRFQTREELSTAIRDRESRRYHLWRTAIFAIIIGSLTFNFFLAFANTNLFGITDSYVILVELILIASTLALALDRKAAPLTILAVFLGYMVFILAMRSELDLKAVRDILIPLAFYFAGKKLRRIEDADQIVFISAYIVVGVGLFEFLFLDTFTRFVNIFDYYVARGTLNPDDALIEGSNLFISATRFEGRNFFPFLGNTRASSVFLEPVTMGNFGAFLCLWALFRHGMKNRFLLFVLAFMVILLGDARFGMYVCVAFFLVMPFYRLVPRIIWWFTPFTLILALAIYGTATDQLTWEDNFAGRFYLSSQLLLELDTEMLFGISPEQVFLEDSGYAATLAQIGLVGVLALWTLFVFAPAGRPEGHKFKVLAIVFISLMMIVSNSFYSIKLAALFWFCAGAADGWRHDPAPRFRAG